MTTRRSILQLAAGGVLTAATVGVSASAAQAASYRWLDANRQSKQWSYEPSSSVSKKRNGVNSEIINAAGGSWKSELWLGNGYSQGSTTANVGSTSLTNDASKLRWTFLPSPDDTGKLRTLCTITAPGGGTMRTAQGTSESSSTAALPDGTQVDYLGLSVTQASAAKSLGGVPSTDFWTILDTAGNPTLVASQDTYTASTRTSASEFAKSGLTLTLATKEGYAQAVQLPVGVKIGSALLDQGFQQAGDDLYVLTKRVKSDKRLEVPVGSPSRSASSRSIKLTIFGDDS